METNNETVGAVAKKKMTVTVVTDLPAEKELYKVAEILTKLRYRTKYWEDNYGGEAKNRKKDLERIADKWIDEHVKIEEL